MQRRSTTIVLHLAFCIAGCTWRLVAPARWAGWATWAGSRGTAVTRGCGVLSCVPNARCNQLQNARCNTTFVDRLCMPKVAAYKCLRWPGGVAPPRSWATGTWASALRSTCLPHAKILRPRHPSYHRPPCFPCPCPLNYRPLHLILRCLQHRAESLAWRAKQRRMGSPHQQSRASTGAREIRVWSAVPPPKGSDPCWIKAGVKGLADPARCGLD